MATATDNIADDLSMVLIADSDEYGAENLECSIPCRDMASQDVR